MENYYEVLCVDPGASAEEVKQQYQQLLMTVHPDKLQQQGMAPDVAAQQTTNFHNIHKAWKILGDPELRKEYDACWKQRMVVQQWPVQEDVLFDNFEVEDDGNFTYPCRCGGIIELTTTDVTFQMDYATCSICSLCIKVCYEETDHEGQ